MCSIAGLYCSTQESRGFHFRTLISQADSIPALKCDSHNRCYVLSSQTFVLARFIYRNFLPYRILSRSRSPDPRPFSTRLRDVQHSPFGKGVRSNIDPGLCSSAPRRESDLRTNERNQTSLQTIDAIVFNPKKAIQCRAFPDRLTRLFSRPASVGGMPALGRRDIPCMLLGLSAFERKGVPLNGKIIPREYFLSIRSCYGSLQSAS